MILFRSFLRILILCSLCNFLSNIVKAQTNTVPDAVELAALKNLYDSLGGVNWTNKTNWPSPGNWPATATAAQMATWHGVSITNGDISSIALSNNNLAGVLPSTLSNLKRLRYLYFERNNIAGPIPTSYGKLNQLNNFYLSSNKLTGSIPESFGGLTQVISLRLDNNLLTGSILANLGSLTNLRELYLQLNSFTGTIPSTLGNLNQLKRLFLNKNQLSGGIPAEMKSLTKLEYFDVSENSLAGEIPPEFSTFTGMIFFNLYKNSFSGALPNFSQWSNIVEIKLGYNKFDGNFPATIGNCTTLTKLSAQNNFFSSLPDQLLTLPVLNTVDFTSNMLNRIPAFENQVNKTNLYLYVDYNKLDFGQLETLYNKGIKTVLYVNQTGFSDLSFVRVDPNGTLLIPARNAGINGAVTWERMIEGGSTWVSITSQDQDATRKTFLKTPFTSTEDGKFRYKMTNTLFPGKTLTSDPIAVRVGSLVVWNEQLGVSESNGILSSTVAQGRGNAKAVTENMLLANQGGSLEFVTDNASISNNYAIGFTTTTAGNTLADLEYGIEIINTGTNKILVHESSATGVDLGAWVVGDYFKIDRQGTTISYYKNGTLMRTTSVSSSKDYIIKSLINTGQAPQVMSSFWIPASRGLVPDAWEYAALKDIYDNMGGPTWINKTNWPTTGNWITNFTAAQMDTWFGIGIENGDITILSLLQNNLTGAIPLSISKLSSLKTIDFRINKIGGTIPLTITKLTNLKELKLYDNLMTGEIPPNIGDLTNLEYFTVAKNDLTGQVPPSVGSMTKLYWFAIYRNANLTGALPSTFYSLVNLTDLYIYDTQINGTLAPEISNFTKLKNFWGYRNSWSGTLPPTLGNILALENLYLYTNSFEGDIPENWRHLSNLKNLWIHENKLTSEIPSWLGELNKMVVLSIGDEINITGTIPKSLQSLTNLTGLYFYKTNISGTIPDELAALTKLNIVDLKFTGLTGAIPSWLMNMPTMKEFGLNNSKFTGLPDFTSRTDKSTLKIYVESNQIPVADIERYFTGPNIHPFSAFTYSGQQNLKLVSSIQAKVKTELKIEAPSGGAHGVYVWERLVNGSWININSQNQSSTSNIFSIPNAPIDKTGTYRYTVTNSWLPDIQFESGPIAITVYDPVATAIDEFAFQYRYDYRNRLIKKKIPGADWVYMVYDNRDRLVMTQDGNQRAKEIKEWTFTKYDALNRPVLTGIYKDPSGKDQSSMQTEVNDYYANIEGKAWYETYVGPEGTEHGYDNLSFPQVSSANDYITVSYYDDYDFAGAIAENSELLSYDGQQLLASANDKAQDAAPFSSVKDQLTGTKTKNLETNEWYFSVFYYDDNYRLIQTTAENHKGGYDKTTNVFDFVGKVLRTKTEHTVIGKDAQSITHKFEYDHAGRLLKTWHGLNDATPVLLSQNEYNELGQLVTKKLHSDDNGSSFKQHEDYRYNIRGWLTRINNADLNTDDEGPKDFFGMEFGYNNDLGIGAFTPQYNGNISATKWSANLGLGLPSLNEPTERAYKFTYDPMNRLREANHTLKIGSWTSTLAHREAMDYDLNGNISLLYRNNERGSPMDWLTYDYGDATNKGNQLKSVTDHGLATRGFKDGNSTGADYTYDANGNMVQDKNKGLGSIKFNNYLNLTEEINKDSGEKIKYKYNGDGVKLAEEIFQAGSSTPSQRTDYMGAFVYQNDTLKFIQHEEGKIIIPKPESSDPSPEYQYQIRDHLGNTRLTFTTKQKTDEYKATMEDTGVADITNPRVQELAYFDNLFETEITNVNQWLNHTSEASGNAIYLDASSEKTIGPSITLRVYPGDTVNMEAYGKFENKSTHSAMTVTTLLTALLNPVSTAMSLEGVLTTNTDFSNAIRSLLANKGSDETKPAADLNYILFDKNWNVIKYDYDRMSEDAGFDPTREYEVDFDKLQLNKIIDHDGYLFVYVSNESPASRVWFDDLTITYSHSPIVQFEDYYPLGLSMSGTAFERGNDKYKGMVTPDGTGLKDLGFRQYDPVIGRFHAVDPLAELQLDNSTYQFAGNNPVSQIDVLGLDKDDRKKHKEERKVNGKKIKVHNGFENKRHNSHKSGNKNGSDKAQNTSQKERSERKVERKKEREERRRNRKSGGGAQDETDVIPSDLIKNFINALNDKSNDLNAVFDSPASENKPQRNHSNIVNSVNNGSSHDISDAFSENGVKSASNRSSINLPIAVIRAYQSYMTDDARNQRQSFQITLNEKRALEQRTNIEHSLPLKLHYLALSNTSTNDDEMFENDPDNFLDKILPEDVSSADKQKYKDLLVEAKTKNGVKAKIEPDDWVTDQIWFKDGETYYDGNKEILNAKGVPVKIKNSKDYTRRQCWEATQIIMRNAGYTSGISTKVYQVALEHKTEEKLVYFEDQMDKGLRNILDHLMVKRPVQVGIHYKWKGGYNSDKTTDHFLVITGMKYDEESNQYYFEVYEPGTGNKDVGTNDGNRLYIVEEDGQIKLKGARFNNAMPYEVTEIRPNGDFSSPGTIDANKYKPRNPPAPPCEEIVCK